MFYHNKGFNMLIMVYLMVDWTSMQSLWLHICWSVIFKKEKCKHDNRIKYCIIKCLVYLNNNLKKPKWDKTRNWQ